MRENFAMMLFICTKFSLLPFLSLDLYESQLAAPEHLIFYHNVLFEISLDYFRLNDCSKEKNACNSITVCFNLPNSPQGFHLCLLH